MNHVNLKIMHNRAARKSTVCCVGGLFKKHHGHRSADGLSWLFVFTPRKRFVLGNHEIRIVPQELERIKLPDCEQRSQVVLPCDLSATRGLVILQAPAGPVQDLAPQACTLWVVVVDRSHGRTT